MKVQTLIDKLQTCVSGSEVSISFEGKILELASMVEVRSTSFAGGCFNGDVLLTCEEKDKEKQHEG